MLQADYVYHGTSHEITNGCLIPSARSTTRIDGEHRPLVYANENLGGAYAYALSNGDTVAIDAVGSQPYIVIRDRKAFERDFKGGTIYKFPSRLFARSMPETSATCIDEWITDKPVPLSAAVEVIKVPDIDAAIRQGGVKVFFVSDPAQAKQVGDAIVSAENKDGPDHTAARLTLINSLLKEGVLTQASAAPEVNIDIEVAQGGAAPPVKIHISVPQEASRGDGRSWAEASQEKAAAAVSRA